MLEILKSNFYLPLYAITWVISIVKLPKYYDSALKFLPIIIGYTLFTEILGVILFNLDDFTLISSNEYSHYNLIIYSIYDVVFFLFFYHIYWGATTDEKKKKLIKRGGLLFLLVMFLNSYFINPLLNDMVYAYVIGALILVLTIINFLIHLKKTSSVNAASKNLLFWISIGLLIFHIGYIPIMIAKNTDSTIILDNYDKLRQANLYLILLMYTCFIIGFLKMKRFK